MEEKIHILQNKNGLLCMSIQIELLLVLHQMLMHF